MNKKIWYVIILILILIGATAYLICKSSEKQKETANQITNPASVYCEQQGGKLTIQTQSDGSQIGICSMNGKQCEEWKYFRGECEL